MMGAGYPWLLAAFKRNEGQNRRQASNERTRATFKCREKQDVVLAQGGKGKGRCGSIALRRPQVSTINHAEKFKKGRAMG